MKKLLLVLFFSLVSLFPVTVLSQSVDKNITIDLNVTATFAHYYYKGSGNLNEVSSWGSNPDGSGNSPSSFAESYAYFHIVNTSSVKLDGNWTITGVADMVYIGDGTNAVELIIGDTATTNITLVVKDFGKLTLEGSTLPDIDTIEKNSTIEFAIDDYFVIPRWNYGNLSLRDGTKEFDDDTTFVRGSIYATDVRDLGGSTTQSWVVLNGDFTMSHSEMNYDNPSHWISLICNGDTIQQTFNGNYYEFYIKNLEINNEAEVILVGSGQTHMTVGTNNWGGRLTFYKGNILTNGNTIELYGEGIFGETSSKGVIGKISVTEEVGFLSSNFKNIGFELSAGSDDLGSVDVIRYTGEENVYSFDRNETIYRSYDVMCGTDPIAGRDITIHWFSSEINGKDLTQGVMIKSTSGEGDFYAIATGDYSVSNSATVLGDTLFGIYSITDAATPLPVELTSFTVTASSNGANLAWSTATETNNAGWNVERSSGNQWQTIGFVSGKGTTTAAQSYSFTDSKVIGKVQYRLKQVDNNGNYTYSNVLAFEVMPTSFDVLGNYPNPFNPSTMLRFTLPQTGKVRVVISNVLGQQVAVVADREFNAGIIDLPFNAANLSSGMYYYTITANGKSVTKTMMLMK